jgi:hypothetical protein
MLGRTKLAVLSASLFIGFSHPVTSVAYADVVIQATPKHAITASSLTYLTQVDVSTYLRQAVSSQSKLTISVSKIDAGVTADNIRQVQQVINQISLPELQKVLGRVPEGKWTVYLASTQESYRNFIGSTPSDYSVGVCSNHWIAVNLQAVLSERSALQDTLTHELTHAVFVSYGLLLPAWLNEGIAQYVGMLAAGLDPAQKASWMTNWLIDQHINGDIVPTLDQDYATYYWEYEGEAAVCPLIQKAGWPSFRQFLFQDIPKSGVDSAFKRVFGQSLTSYKKAFYTKITPKLSSVVTPGRVLGFTGQTGTVELLDDNGLALKFPFDSQGNFRITRIDPLQTDRKWYATINIPDESDPNVSTVYYATWQLVNGVIELSPTEDPCVGRGSFTDDTDPPVAGVVTGLPGPVLNGYVVFSEDHGSQPDVQVPLNSDGTFTTNLCVDCWSPLYVVINGVSYSIHDCTFGDGEWQISLNANA